MVCRFLCNASNFPYPAIPINYPSVSLTSSASFEIQLRLIHHDFRKHDFVAFIKENVQCVSKIRRSLHVIKLFLREPLVIDYIMKIIDKQ